MIPIRRIESVNMADISSLHTFAGVPYQGQSGSYSRIPTLQRMCSTEIENKWEALPAQDVAYLVNGDAPEAVQRLLVKRLVQHRAKYAPASVLMTKSVNQRATMLLDPILAVTWAIIQTVLPSTGIFGADNPEERLALLEQLAHDMKILKTQEKMRSEVHKWCTILRNFLESDASEKLSPQQAAESDMDWHQKKAYTHFPRPQCDSEIQIRQILDILDRCRIVSHESDNTSVGKDSASTLVSTIEVDVRAPSKTLTELINALPDGTDRHGSTPTRSKDAFCGEKEGTISLTLSLAHEMPHHGDSSARVSLLVGTDQYWGYKLFQYATSYSDEGPAETGEQLQALKSRLLHGAPGVEEDKLTDQQFMTLLLLLFLGHEVVGYLTEHYTYFVGYFSNDEHRDDLYE